MECTPNLWRVMNGFITRGLRIFSAAGRESACEASAAKKRGFKRFEPLSVSLVGDITSEQQLDICGNMNVAD